MDPTKQPGIHIEGVFLDNFEIFRNPATRAQQETSFEFDMKLQKKILVFPEVPEGKAGSATLSVFLADKKSDFRVSCTYTIIARTTEEENMSIQDFLERNGLATAYQYIREAISNMAQRTGVQNLFIPPMNFAAMQWAENVQAGLSAEKA